MAPRNVSKKRKTEDDMVAAIEDVEEKQWTVSKASREHGIPRQTLYDRIGKKHR